MIRAPRALLALLLSLPLLLGLAPAEGIIAFSASPDAEVVVHPRSDPLRIDVMVRRNRVPLDRQLDGLTARHLSEIEVVSIGGGTWFVTLYVERPEIVVVPQVIPGKLVLRLRPGRVGTIEVPEAPTLRELLDDPPQRLPAPPPPLALSPLRGDASTLKLRPDLVLQDLPVWRIRGRELSKLQGWPAVDAYRMELALHDHPARQAATRYHLGLEHLGLGWYREAAFYLEETLASDVPYDVPAVALATARAQLVLDRTQRSRELCRMAADNGAEDVAVLVCLGAVALKDGTPSPTAVGRALEQASLVPSHRLLAAQLLQQDHRHAEARQILEALAYSMD
ncbi:MAG TPA: hypothetical protein ENK18_09270 [Deltaproteobacteria bacterium]|nr:hypothetical protein [Deltaproteobacteria bacterium]